MRLQRSSEWMAFYAQGLNVRRGDKSGRCPTSLLSARSAARAVETHAYRNLPNQGVKSARLQGYGCSLPLWLAVVLGTIMLIRSQIATAATAVAAMVLSVSGYAGTHPGN